MRGQDGQPPLFLRTSSRRSPSQFSASHLTEDTPHTWYTLHLIHFTSDTLDTWHTNLSTLPRNNLLNRIKKYVKHPLHLLNFWWFDFLKACFSLERNKFSPGYIYIISFFRDWKRIPWSDSFNMKWIVRNLPHCTNVYIINSYYPFRKRKTLNIRTLLKLKITTGTTAIAMQKVFWYTQEDVRDETVSQVLEYSSEPSWAS